MEQWSCSMRVIITWQYLLMTKNVINLQELNIVVKSYYIAFLFWSFSFSASFKNPFTCLQANFGSKCYKKSRHCTAKYVLSPSSRSLALRSNQPLEEMSTKSLTESRVRLARKAYIFADICIPKCRFSSSLYPQSCWCIIKVIHNL
jgi:hypothetical protein